jgi:hypothetical protein
MINELNLENIYEEFVNRLNIEESRGVDEDPVEMLKRSPENFMNILKNKNLKLEKFDRDTHIKLFYIVCNKLKEIERETKLLGLEIMSHLIDFIPEPYFMNAYVFEKELIAKVPQQNLNQKKKFVSVGDYELAKFDSSMGINYGFFASVLEEEKKEIKINTLKIISVIGAKETYKEFAIKSFRYIIELVNDEEDEVRYETVKTLEDLITNFKSIEVSD